MKRILLIFLTFALLLGQNTAILCFAAEPGEVATLADAPMQTEEMQTNEQENQPQDSGVPDLSGGVVTGLDYERIFAGFSLESYEKGKLKYLYFFMDTITAALDCTVVLPDGSQTAALCTASWNTAELTLDTPGLYDVIATLIPPIGCSFGEDVRTQIVVPVQILDSDAPVQITGIDSWNPYAVAIAIAQGSSLESVTESPLMQDYTTEVLKCKDENGASHALDIRWDFTPIRLDEPGLYTITGTPVLPDWAVFAEVLTPPQPTATISVQATGKPDINCFYLLYPDVWFPWIAPTAGAETATVWLSEEGGAWQELTATGQADATQDSIRIKIDTFTKGSNYRVQADYEGGQTGILSFSWDDTIVIDGYWGGDRDGNDNDDNTLDPPMTQPPPRPPVTLPPLGGGSEGDSDGSGGGSDNGGSTGGGSDTPSDPTPPPVMPPPTTPPVMPPSGGNGPAPEPTPPPVAPPPATPPSGGNGPAPEPTPPPVAPPPVTPPSKETTDESSTLVASTPPATSAQGNNGGNASATKPTDKDDRQGYERVDGDSMEISGARLAWLLEQNTPLVPFGWNEVSLEVPVSFFKKLSLAPEDMLSMTLTRESDLGFTLALSAKGEMVTELESTLVRLSAPKPQHTYKLSLSGNTLETPVAYENGCAVFSITQTGLYELTDEPTPLSDAPTSAPPQETKAPPALPAPMADDFLPLALTGAVLLLGGGFWLWRKHR